MSTITNKIRSEIEAITRINKPTLNDIGELLKRSITKNFQVGGRHNGSPANFAGGSQRWVDLAPSTKRGRTRKGRAGNTAKGDAPFLILVRQGLLRNSITYRVVGDDTIYIGSNLVYAAIHHFGGNAGRGLKTKIPARPWLVVQDDDIKNIGKIIRGSL